MRSLLNLDRSFHGRPKEETVEEGLSIRSTDLSMKFREDVLDPSVKFRKAYRVLEMCQSLFQILL